MDLGKLRKLAVYRKCQVCGVEFHSDKDGTALQKFSDHMIIHWPTPEQWNEAYDRMRAGK